MLREGRRVTARLRAATRTRCSATAATSSRCCCPDTGLAGARTVAEKVQAAVQSINDGGPARSRSPARSAWPHIRRMAPTAQRSSSPPTARATPASAPAGHVSRRRPKGWRWPPSSSRRSPKPRRRRRSRPTPPPDPPAALLTADPTAVSSVDTERLHRVALALGNAQPAVRVLVDQVVADPTSPNVWRPRHLDRPSDAAGVCTRALTVTLVAVLRPEEPPVGRP